MNNGAGNQTQDIPEIVLYWGLNPPGQMRQCDKSDSWVILVNSEWRAISETKSDTPKRVFSEPKRDGLNNITVSDIKYRPGGMLLENEL